jgi:hypothetical protein
MKIKTDLNMGMDTDTIKDKDTDMNTDVRYRILVKGYSNLPKNVGFRLVQTDLIGSDIRFSPILFVISDIRPSANLQYTHSTPNPNLLHV